MEHALTSRALRHFVVACDCGNLTVAATQVGVTQPAITKSIRRLEEQLGVQLFERRPKGLVPTRFGRMLREHAQSILNQVRYVSTEIAAATGGTGGEVRIGVGPAWSLSVFPEIVADLRQTLPGVDVIAHVGIRERILQQLMAGEIDLWLGSLFEIPADDDLTVIVSGQVEMSVFAAEDHLLAQRTRVAPAEMEGCAWAGFVDDVIGLGRLEAYFLGHGVVPPRIALKSSSVASIFAAARRSGLLVYAADSLAGEARLRGLVPLPLAHPIWSFDTGLAFKRAAGGLAAIDRIAHLLRDGFPPSTGRD